MYDPRGLKRQPSQNEINADFHCLLNQMRGITTEQAACSAGLVLGNDNLRVMYDLPISEVIRDWNTMPGYQVHLRDKSVLPNEIEHIPGTGYDLLTSRCHLVGAIYEAPDGRGTFISTYDNGFMVTALLPQSEVDPLTWDMVQGCYRDPNNPYCLPDGVTIDNLYADLSKLVLDCGEYAIRKATCCEFYHPRKFRFSPS